MAQSFDRKSGALRQPWPTAFVVLVCFCIYPLLFSGCSDQSMVVARPEKAEVQEKLGQFVDLDAEFEISYIPISFYPHLSAWDSVTGISSNEAVTIQLAVGDERREGLVHLLKTTEFYAWTSGDEDSPPLLRRSFLRREPGLQITRLRQVLNSNTNDMYLASGSIIRVQENNRVIAVGSCDKDLFEVLRLLRSRQILPIEMDSSAIGMDGSAGSGKDQ